MTVRDTSPGPTGLRFEVDVAAPVERTWAAATDWDRQGEWMLGTTVRGTVNDGRGVGGRLRAVTGIGRLGVVDTMEITGWDPPYGAYVTHLGRIVRGTAAFEVRQRSGGSTFVWSEQLDLPLGAVGRLGFRLVRPALAAGLTYSLRRFAGWAQRHPGGVEPGSVVPPASVPAVDDITVGADGRARCGWAGATADYQAYHDEEWGRPQHDGVRLFEKLCLEAFQSGLSWLTILRKREAFRAAFAGFEPAAVAGFGPADVERLLADRGIVRNRAKIEAAIGNARATLELPDGLPPLLWSFAPAAHVRPRSFADLAPSTPESTAMARDLRRRGFRFVGPTTAYALMQACGLVDDHLTACWRATAPAAA